jgi:hypothetical protein
MDGVEALGIDHRLRPAHEAKGGGGLGDATRFDRQPDVVEPRLVQQRCIAVSGVAEDMHVVPATDEVAGQVDVHLRQPGVEPNCVVAKSNTHDDSASLDESGCRPHQLYVA